jgi:adenosylcobinamide kinase/adenosylcobinamide-phosphate guanylyltransferase
MMNMPEFRIALVLGGARSGKSHYGESLAKSVIATNLLYVATAEARDDEMRERIAHHRAARADGWRTIEEPLDLARVVRQATRDDVVLVDCLTLWLSNILLAGRSAAKEADTLCAALTEAPARIVLVANEVGLGIVPDNPLARRFRDEAGLLNQRMATVADHVAFMAAGLPLVLKGG